MVPVTKSCSSGVGIDVFDGIRAGRLKQISIDVNGECSRIEKVERSRLQIDGKEVSFESLDLSSATRTSRPGRLYRST
ncbi:MAG: hypothetical protein VX528_05255, partial [Candidatus Latescibacterota bacterium]|nr:hypothetical protein [Candidatus Latescibacterota bacterium]